ncbi:MAG: hypothetical protein HY540_05080, partial [Deltaproteobacteria bacterium]|nr:hypothetical protein [Deltaproteobacteria bacterium]
KNGTTYRVFDWNRQPARELHTEQTLQVTNFDGLRGQAFIDSIRRQEPKNLIRRPSSFETIFTAGDFMLQRLCLANTKSDFETMTYDVFAAITVVSGALMISSAMGAPAVRVNQGYSALIPGVMSMYRIRALQPGSLALITRPV